MSERSLQVSVENLVKVRQRLRECSLNQTSIAEEVGLSRSTSANFFNGKPVDRSYFGMICERLGYEWEELVSQPPSRGQENQDSRVDIDALVQETREKVKPSIERACGTMKVLEMTQKIALTGEQGIYTNVNILERITGRRRLGIAELSEKCKVDEFDRFGLSPIAEECVSGLVAVERYDKLMVLGKPGAGKTTFLKYLAMQCIEGSFEGNRVPVFVTLKDFAEADNQPDLVSYLERSATPIKTLLSSGRALVLLDGLDEVREEHTKRVLRQIRECSEAFPNNQFVVTCRIAAKEYTFQHFTEVEVADFNDEQIQTFANNWFRAKGVDSRGKLFIQKLNSSEPIKELATNPLLLTLLCLIFEDLTDFPANRSELYKEGIDVLLKKWDGSREIERGQTYKNLSLKRKENLLSEVALTTFENKDYFFKKKTVEGYIANYIGNLPEVMNDPEKLEFDSEAILKSIEAQHGLLIERAKGIYSFSHLTFHEYFASAEIINISDYTRLARHVTEKRWREIFFLAAGMMPKADTLLLKMKQEIDKLIAEDETLQQFLV